MTAGRRGLPLSLAFLALAVLAAHATPTRAQFRPGPPPQTEGSHRLWQGNLTPEQLKAALTKLADGGDLDPFQQMVRDYLQKNNSGIDQDKAAELIKKFTGDKQFMEQLKQMARQKQTDPGRTGKLAPEDLAKLFKTNPDGTPGLRPPLGDPKVGIDPKSGLPPTTIPKIDLKADPKGDPENPEGPRKLDIEPIPPQGGPPNPANPGPPNANIPLEDRGDLFGNPEGANDPRNKSLAAFAAMWERNVGPLDETPEVKRALFDLVGGNGFDFDIKDGSGKSFWDLLKNGPGDGSGFGDMMNGADAGGWKFPTMEWPKMGSWFGSGGGGGGGSGSGGSWFGGRSSGPRPVPSGSSGGGGGFNLGSGGSWLPVALLALAILGLLLWAWVKNFRAEGPAAALAGEGLGPWPVDPRAINTREDVVRAFEYLSVLICGPSARNWTHGTIAEALSDLAATHGETAVMLARLYELARYAPLDEPLTREELTEARVLVCDLAGVS